MAVSITVRGAKALAAKLRGLAARTPARVAAALYAEAELIMTRAKTEFIPVDLGTLRRSGKVHPPKITGRTIEVRLAVGDDASPYALAVHEHPSGASPPSWRGLPVGSIHGVRTGQPWSVGPTGRGPKYLERPLKQAIRGMDKRIAAAVKVSV